MTASPYGLGSYGSSWTSANLVWHSSQRLMRETELHRFPVHTNLWNRDYDPRFDLVVTARFTVSHYDYFSD